MTSIGVSNIGQVDRSGHATHKACIPQSYSQSVLIFRLLIIIAWYVDTIIRRESSSYSPLCHQIARGLAKKNTSLVFS